MTPNVTYLVGTPRRYREYCRDHGVSTRGWYVVHVESMLDTQSATLRDQVLFLTGWQELPEWRQLYNWAIIRQSVIRLILEAREYEDEGDDGP